MAAQRVLPRLPGTGGGGPAPGPVSGRLRLAPWDWGADSDGLSAAPGGLRLGVMNITRKRTPPDSGGTSGDRHFWGTVRVPLTVASVAEVAAQEQPGPFRQPRSVGLRVRAAVVVTWVGDRPCSAGRRLWAGRLLCAAVHGVGHHSGP